MRFEYSISEPTQDQLDVLPRLPLILINRQHRVNASALVDSGATVNVMPYSLGLQLGAVWVEKKAVIRLGGMLGDQLAMPFFANIVMGDYAPVRQAFALIKSDTTPLVLGQVNFFIEFDICFFRSRGVFEVSLKSI